MISQISQAITFHCFYTKSKVGVAPSSAPTVNVERKGSGSLVVSGGTTSAGLITGHYEYTLSSGSDGTADDYCAVFHTSDTTVDMQDLPSLWIVGNSFAALEVAGNAPGTDGGIFLGHDAGGVMAGTIVGQTTVVDWAGSGDGVSGDSNGNPMVDVGWWNSVGVPPLPANFSALVITPLGQVRAFDSSGNPLATSSVLASVLTAINKLTFDGSNNVKSTPQTAVQLAGTQPNWAPVRTSDAVASVTGAVGSVTSPVTLTSAYDAAKTAAAPGVQMDLVNAPNATAVTAFANGLLDLANSIDSGGGADTPRHALRLIAAALAGKVTISLSGGVYTITMRDTADTKNRIVATADASGDRTAFTYNNG